MVARKYALVADAKMPVKCSGQARIVWDALKADTTPRLATAVTNAIGELPTRQDKHRVVLYYILVFKTAGLVRAFENIVEETEQLSFDMTEMMN